MLELVENTLSGNMPKTLTPGSCPHDILFICFYADAQDRLSASTHEDMVCLGKVETECKLLALQGVLRVSFLICFVLTVRKSYPPSSCYQASRDRRDSHLVEKTKPAIIEKKQNKNPTPIHLQQNVKKERKKSLSKILVACSSNDTN